MTRRDPMFGYASPFRLTRKMRRGPYMRRDGSAVGDAYERERRRRAHRHLLRMTRRHRARLEAA